MSKGFWAKISQFDFEFWHGLSQKKNNIFGFSELHHTQNSHNFFSVQIKAPIVFLALPLPSLPTFLRN
jgi:hypothetical protein